MIDLQPLVPFLTLVVAGLVSLLLVRPSATEGKVPNRALAAYTLAALGIALLSAIQFWVGHPGGFRESFFGGAFVVDNFSTFMTALVAGCGILTVLATQPHAAQEGMDHAELYALLLFAVAGMVLLAAGADLVVLFLGVETMSLAVYALVGLRRRHAGAGEATMKYVLLGAFSSAVLLYGIAMIYGGTGSTNLYQIAAYQEAAPGSLHGAYLVGLFLLVAGLAFKVAAFPFHMWVPDVYEGAAAPITGFMATAVKAASFAMLLRAVLVGFSGLQADLGGVIWLLAVSSMFVGNILALPQRNLKRMLAYSSIAHTGYLLIGLVAASRANPSGATAMLVYLAAYAFTNLGAFACVAYVSSRDERRVTLDSWAGLVRAHPWITVAMTVCLLSLIGFPPTAGFFGKYLLFTAAIEAGQAPLAFLGIVNSILSVWYYLRVVVVMTMKDPVPEEAVAEPGLPVRWGAGIGAAYATLAVIWAGLGTFTLAFLLPGAQSLLTWARLSLDTLF